MKKFIAFALIIFTTTAVFAQQKDSISTKHKKKDWSKVLLGNRANDHFMFQIGYDNWFGTPDTIRTKGFSRSFNFYFMFDFPFKSDPRFSVGAGLGIGSSNIFFDKQEVLVAALNPTLAFPDRTASDHFKKYKLVSTYLEAPLELRFALNPENTNKSWKFAIGGKLGLLLSTYTKGKTLQNSAGQTINSSIEKESSKKYFNGTRFAGTARISYGVVGIFVQYSLTPFIKTTYGPSINPYSIGITLSGL
ncbi:MAG: outer membrane beta-barrel protein [Bacteroidetes bacterium]|nr:outer membrane beta-barrel protein [Bacteroidota bacterium]